MYSKHAKIKCVPALNQIIIFVPLSNMTSVAPLSVVLSLFSQRTEGKRGRSGGHIWKGYKDYSLMIILYIIIYIYLPIQFWNRYFSVAYSLEVTSIYISSGKKRFFICSIATDNLNITLANFSVIMPSVRVSGLKFDYSYGMNHIQLEHDTFWPSKMKFIRGIKLTSLNLR